jgi:SAM-dependent methyltransferase
MDQVAYWNGPAGERWTREQEGFDGLLRPFGQAALDAANVAAGEAVADVGCGCGDSSLALSAIVGSRGHVVGVDVSAPMLARAKERCARCPNASFVLGDASSGLLPRGGFDLLFSRFGVMFFQDPTRAFARLRDALRADGRIAFVCWRALSDNPWASVPFDAVADVLGRPEPQAADEPGPFAFGDPGRVRGILESAGLREIKVEPFDRPVVFGASGFRDDAVDEIVRLGPVARLLVERNQSDIDRALMAIRGVIPDYERPEGGVHFPAAVWVVTGRNP